MHIAVIGAGSWGTALAIHLARNGHEVTLSGRPSEVVDPQQRHNHHYLPDITFPATLRYAPWSAALASADWVLLAVPSHAFANTLLAMQAQMTSVQPIAWATKGLLGGRLLSAVAQDLFGQMAMDSSADAKPPPMAVVSGPTFAKELAQGLPTAITVAGDNTEFTQTVAAALHGVNFRAYRSDDMLGVQIGGAVKNVMAVAAGAADGLGFGANARTALITRGLAEMRRLGEALGAQGDTFMGLAGLGDLVLTCSDDQSRNRRFGKALATGLDADAAEASIGQVVEGRCTTQEVYHLAKAQHIDMPIVQQVWRVLYADLPLRQAVTELLERPAKTED